MHLRIVVGVVRGKGTGSRALVAAYLPQSVSLPVAHEVAPAAGAVVLARSSTSPPSPIPLPYHRVPVGMEASRQHNGIDSDQKLSHKVARIDLNGLE